MQKSERGLGQTRETRAGTGVVVVHTSNPSSTQEAAFTGYLSGQHVTTLSLVQNTNILKRDNSTLSW